MIKRLKTAGRATVTVIFCSVIISGISCSDMYSEMLENLPKNYQLGIFVTTMTTSNYLLLANRDISLYQKTQFSGHSTGYAGSLADFNGDRNLDMLTVAPDAPHMIAFTDGKGNITGYYDFSSLTSNDYANKTVTADFDRDGDMDIFITASNPGKNKIYLNNGNGTFSNGPEWTFGSINYTDICTGDFNRDGLPDIFLFHYTGSDGISDIYLGNGNGSFSAGPSYTLNIEFSFSAAGDLDNDGDIDIIQGIYGGTNAVNIYHNNGDATFQLSTGPAFTAASIALGDIDGDGDLDAYVGTDDGVDLSFLINNGAGVFTVSPHTSAISAAITEVEMADMDADGDIDVVAYQYGVLRVYINDGNLVFTRYKDFPVGSVTSISIGRFIR